MRQVCAWAACLVMLVPLAALGQQPATATNAKISELETNLAKQRETSPEAAELMVQLADLYYAEGRVFGLIRVTQSVVNQHTSHPQHKAMMLKLIDGLQATSRNKELAATCRQFLTRYPDDDQCAAVEITLAWTLEQLDDLAKTAEAHEAVWQRAGDTPDGRRALVRAVDIYAQQNRRDGFVHAAELAESAVDRLSPGELAEQMGINAVLTWQRLSDWGKSVAVGQKLLKKKMPSDPAVKSYLHWLLAQSDFSQSQRANGVEHLKKSFALRPDRAVQLRLISEWSQAGAKPEELKPLVDDYLSKYPARADRFQAKSHLASAYLAAQDTATAAQLFRELLVEDATARAAATQFVRLSGTSPEQLAETEKALLDAIAKNPDQAATLRFALAFELYRDRMKDLDKARAIALDLATKSPTNDVMTVNTIHWLLSNAKDETSFHQDVAALLKARSEHLYWPTYRDAMLTWGKQARNSKTTRTMGEYAIDEVHKANTLPEVKQWADADDGRRGLRARAKLLEKGTVEKLTREQLRYVLVKQGETYRILMGGEARRSAVDLYGEAAAKFPQDFPIAVAYLEAATDAGIPEVSKEAALHLLTLSPPDNVPDSWRRLMLTADGAQDAKLVAQAWKWIQDSQQLYGPAMTHSSVIGDVLAKNGLTKEAVAYWQRTIDEAPSEREARLCVERIAATLEPAARLEFLRKIAAQAIDYHGAYAMMVAAELVRSGDYAGAAKALNDSATRQLLRASRPWGMEEQPLRAIINLSYSDQNAKPEDRRQLYTAIRDLRVWRASAVAATAVLESTPVESMPPMERLLAYQYATTLVGNDSTDWDLLVPYVQAAMARKEYLAVATLSTGMLANIPNVDSARKQSARDLVGQSYARMGAEGLSIDESSPLAPLLQAALYLRLGDQRLAFDTYAANRDLFDKYREQMPVDFVLFVAESHMAAGGDENHDRVEDLLRNWLMKHSESKDVDEPTKAAVQLALAKNFYKSQRFEVARSEYQTVVNRYPHTPQATEAEFGIGESFMSQKVYDQAEQVFDRLANSHDRDVVVRAEFLRGVLANRRGDLDEARDIFRAVLGRVPDVELANQALFNLAEVYGAEQRYMDQLELLRTVGRLGRVSQRSHAPGSTLAIVVQDGDLGISRGHTRVPVRVVTEPGGDEETIYLYSGGAGKGLFRADLETRLGQATKNNKMLELTGRDTIKCDYPPEFKAEFKSVPLSDAEIRIASDGRLELANTQIIHEDEETFSERLERQNSRDDELHNEVRPRDQVKPGNPIYLRVTDPDRDMSDDADTVVTKVVATSGDEVHVELTETGAHTGIFEALANTAELPAGALASDTSIDHSPLMAIDNDPQTYWLSEPDGTAPKFLSVDMKDLRTVDHVVISSPSPDQQVAVRGDLLGSTDGRFWFRLGSFPAEPTAEPVAGEYGPMTQQVYAGDFTRLSDWNQVVELTKTAKPSEEKQVTELSHTSPPGEGGKNPIATEAVVWHGKFVQPRTGAARFKIDGYRTALAIDGKLELPLGERNRTIDVLLEAGTHDLTIFAATSSSVPQAQVTMARESNNASISLSPLTAADFDLTSNEAQAAKIREPAAIDVKDGRWDFRFAPLKLRHARFEIREFLGEAVAINQVTISDDSASEHWIPTDADVLSMSTNDVLEIAANDKVTATYADEVTQLEAGRSQLLTSTLTATYHDAKCMTIVRGFQRRANGQVVSMNNDLVRIDPGERIIVEIADYDADVSAAQDSIEFQVSVNGGEPLTIAATEDNRRPGYFTKEVDTSAVAEEGKLTVKPGDKVYCTYRDVQNTFPGHPVPRETIVYVAEPTDAKIRVVETRYGADRVNVPDRARYRFLPPTDSDIARVAYEVPLTIEVIDPDAARNSQSEITLQVETTGGAKVDVRCVIADAPTGDSQRSSRHAIEEGRFIGQVVMQLGGPGSPDIVPIVSGMPRASFGGGVLPAEEAAEEGSEEAAVVTRVLNVTGKDIIKAVYQDEHRSPMAPESLEAQARVIANATLACVDHDYLHNVEELHVGEKIYLRVVDADRDTSDERDRTSVAITTTLGEQENVELEETLAHSGEFTGSVMLKPEEKPTPGNYNPSEPAIETFFGDQVTMSYVDTAAGTESGELALKIELPVVVGTDGLVAAFSKAFGDETLAVETQFHIAESYFELFKSHQKLGRTEDEKFDLESGRRVLREVMEDYPDPKYAPRIAYLLGQFSQELKQWEDAIESYEMIVKQYPDSPLAPDAQYKLAQCYEESEEFDLALEAYVTLAATYPRSPLIANVMIRISEYFYKAEQYDIAAQVGEKFFERFEGHEWAPRMAFRVGQCYYKGEEFLKAAAAFDKFAKIFPDDALAPDSLFWAGESYRMGGSVSEAFRRYNNCRWSFPSTEAAKYARGRLALPEMLGQFEKEARLDDGKR